LLFGLLFGLCAELITGLSHDKIETRTLPNQGIRRSAQNALSITLLSGLNAKLIGVLHSGLGTGLVGGLFGGLEYGGKTILQHYTLRYHFYRDGSFPFGDLIPSLGYCASPLRHRLQRWHYRRSVFCCGIS
jgi:hypothetical protein